MIKLEATTRLSSAKAKRNKPIVHKWFHLSENWKESTFTVTPRKSRVDDESDPRDTKPFIAVCPSIAQCIAALGAWHDYRNVEVYVAETEENPTPATWVFDYRLTEEHRFYSPTTFKKIGKTINLRQLAESGAVEVREVSGLDDDAKLLANIKKTLKEIFKVFPKDLGH